MSSPTKRARELVQARAAAAVAAQKAVYRDKLEQLKSAFSPALTNTELSAALGVGHPPQGVSGLSDVARFVSNSSRLRNARPDASTRALIDAVCEGTLYIGAQLALPGERRPVLICTPDDVPRLERGWELRSLTQGEIPYGQVAPAWEDGDAWSTFGGGLSEPTATGDGAPPMRYIGPWRVPAIGFGAMRLSTTQLPEDDAIAVLIAALEGGVRLLDTADVYASGPDDLGHNERLIVRALERWGGPRDEVVVATKVGLSRPGGRWAPNGDPEHIRDAVHASLRALQTERLDLVQLHAVDRRFPLADTIGVLAELRDAGKIRCVGLCNVTQAQLEEADAICPIVSVQNPMSVGKPGMLLDADFMRACQQRSIALIAHSPFGGHQRAAAQLGQPRLIGAAQDSGCTPQQAALAWLLRAAPNVIPIPGTTQPTHVRDNIHATPSALTAQAAAKLDALHNPDASATTEARAQAWHAAPLVDEGIVVIMGTPAAGKTTAVDRFVQRGYQRFNRDELGGTLAQLLPHMEQALRDGHRRLVADNTYPTAASRREVTKLGERYGLGTAALWMQTGLDDALLNACHRLLDRVGTLPDPAALKLHARQDPNLFPPAAVHRYAQILEPPHADDGLSAIVPVPFVRRPSGDPERKAVIFDLDGTLRHTQSGAPYPSNSEDIALLPRRVERLQQLADDGWMLLGASNQGGVGLGNLSEATARALCDHTAELLGQTMDIRFCPHPPSGASCWCRKPLPGMGVVLLRDHNLAPERCLMVGDMASDEQFATTCGFAWSHADAFFADGDAWRDVLPR